MSAVKFGMLVCLLAGCGGTGSAEPDAGEVFIALQRDFAHFDTWTSFDLGDDASDGLPATGKRRAYLNKLPPAGSHAFPVGTIVVKTIGDGSPDAGQTFAMVKRGGSYNSAGAPGWEWFELKPADDGTPLIVWRGIAPPAGEAYAGVSGGSCNACHGASPDNDFVPSPELKLSRF